MSGSRKILLPRFDSLGDLILLEGALEAIVRELPDLRLTLLVRRETEQLRPLFPFPVEWICVDLNPYVSRPMPETASEVAGAAAGDWDEIWFTAFGKTWADDLLSFVFADVRQRHLGSPAETGPMLARVLRQLGLQRERLDMCSVAVPENARELDKLRIFCASVLGRSSPELRPRLQVPPAAAEWARSFVAELGWPDRGFVTCVPGGTANVPFKTWPAPNYARIIEWLWREQGLGTLIVGHSSEKDLVRAVQQESASLGVRPASWLGDAGDLGRLAGLLSLSRLYFGNDTGPMHMASALGVPVAAVFGGGTWPRFLPAGPGVAAVREMPCFGCGWDCVFGDGPCIRDVPVDMVREMLTAALSDPAPALECRIFKAQGYSGEVEALIGKAFQRHRELNRTRLGQIEAIEAAYLDSESDRAARLEVIESQGQKLARMDAEIAFLNETIRRLEARLHAATGDVE